MTLVPGPWLFAAMEHTHVVLLWGKSDRKGSGIHMLMQANSIATDIQECRQPSRSSDLAKPKFVCGEIVFSNPFSLHENRPGAASAPL